MIYLNDPDITLHQGDVTCPCGCGRTFSPVGSRGRPRRFYSPGCSLRANNYMRQPGAVNPFKGRQHTDETRAVLSEKARVPKPWLRAERNGMYGRKGPLNPRYVDGSSPERQRAYASAEWRRVSAHVRERDGYRCSRCGAEKNGSRSLHIHHVEPWAGNAGLRFDPDNLVTLCATCHRDEHRKGGEPNQ